uniref:Uncharacterized protein n=1 Tax=Amphimedon queenslandica TaxID=400682 RepID=A0A1X7VFC1_AMPQE
MNDSHKCEFLMRKIILEILLPYLTKFQDKNILGCDELKLSCLKLLLSSLQIALNFFCEPAFIMLVKEVMLWI